MTPLKTRQDCEALCKQYGYNIDTFIKDSRRPDWNRIYRTILLNIGGMKYGRKL